jgi:hypothetical protein
MRPVRRAEKLVSDSLYNVGKLNIPQTYRPPRPVTGIALLLYSHFTLFSFFLFNFTFIKEMS